MPLMPCATGLAHGPTHFFSVFSTHVPEFHPGFTSCGQMLLLALPLSYRSLQRSLISPLLALPPSPHPCGVRKMKWVKSGQFQGFAEQEFLLQRFRGCSGAAAALTPAMLGWRISLSPLEHLCRARGEFLQVPTLHLLVYNDSKVVVLQDAGELPKAVLQADLNRTKRDIERFTSPGNGWALISGEIPCQGLAPGVKSSHI